jgi:nucleoside-diphosphate-sugar epimerase
MGHDVTAVVRPNADTWRLAGLDVRSAGVDVRDRAAVQRVMHETTPDWVFHLAAHGAYSWQQDRASIIAVNVLGTVHLVDAAVDSNVSSVVLAGSSSEYGFKDHAPREDELVEPNSPYAVGKASATLYGQAVSRESNRHVCTLRLYSVYGPWEDPRRLVPRLVTYARDRRLPRLVDPRTARDFVHVDDVCAAFVGAARSTGLPRGTVLNIGTGHQTTIEEVVTVARAVFGIAAEPRWGTMPGRSWDTTSWVADATRASAQLAWQPTTSLEQGLRAFGEWLAKAPAPVQERYRVA